MINIFFNYFLRYFHLFFLRIGLRKTNYKNFNDLNFKYNDFINYKIIKYYVLKESYIANTTIPDIHTFNFLFFYQKLGGKKGIDLSKKNIFTWFKKFKYNKNFPWIDDFASKRLINLFYNYDFICSLSNQKEIDQINYILFFHIKRISFEIRMKKIDNMSSSDILALVLIECSKKNLSLNINTQINNLIYSHLDENSVHKSYNILEHARFLNNLIEIRNIFLFFNVEISQFVKNNILAMTSVLKTYQHADGSLPLFNGCNNNHNYAIQRIFENEQFLKAKTLSNFKNGIAAYNDTNKIIFFDVVQPANFGFHKKLGAGSLAIEISADGEKIITNCGSSEAGGKNPAYLKYSAAHSTLIINNTNISEIKEGGLNKTFPKKVNFETKNEESIVVLSGSHNGYLTNYRKICKRELSIEKENYSIKGKDTIISTKSSIEKNVYHIRFHLMPEISSSITENKKNIIIKTKKNNIWIFKSNKEVVIEKSIFVKNDIAVETSQIVISGITSSLNSQIKWSFDKI